MTDYTNVAARAMKAILSISVWSAQRFDSSASEAVTTSNGAEAHVARVNKHLFGTRRNMRKIVPLFAAVLDAADDLRDLHNRETLPWGNRDGERLLPSVNFFTYSEKVRAAGAVFSAAADAFVDAYPTLQESAKAALGDLYKAEDFIAVKDLRRRFGYSIDFDYISSGRGDVRLDLPADHVSQIEAEITARLERSTRDAMRDAWTRLREAVERIAKATDDGGIVRDTLIDNARNVCDVLTRLNVAEDGDLDRMRELVERELTILSVDDLRKNKALRAETAKHADDILKRIASVYAPAADAAA